MVASEGGLRGLIEGGLRGLIEGGRVGMKKGKSKGRCGIVDRNQVW